MMDDIKRSNVSKFGSIESGSTLYLFSIENRWEPLAEMMRDYVRFNSIEITPKIEADIVEKAKTHYQQLIDGFTRRGVPDNVRALLNCRKKSLLKKLVSKTDLSKGDFALMVANAGQLGFSHKFKTQEFVPEHHQVDHDDIIAITANGVGLLSPTARKVVRKITGTFSERRKVHVHFFKKENEWHCFYFDFRDCHSDIQNHWVLGPHIHLINYLWPNLTGDDVWTSFDKGRMTSLPSLHVRFRMDDPER